jgi:TIR domain
MYVLSVGGESAHQYTWSPRKPDDTTAAQYGGEAFAPLHVINAIYEAREQIRKSKDILRATNAFVEDYPDDELLVSDAQQVFDDDSFNPSRAILGSSSRQLQVFLSYASSDRKIIQDLAERLRQDGFSPWLDIERLLPGQEWAAQIEEAIRTTNVVIICISQRSITKSGFVQKEIKFALDVAEEQPDGAIFIVPLRIDDCDVPRKLKRLQWVDLW